jgi:hypothetical protein
MDGAEVAIAVGSAIGGAFGGVGGASLLVRSYFKSFGIEIVHIKDALDAIATDVEEANGYTRKNTTAIAKIETRCKERHPKEGSDG